MKRIAILFVILVFVNLVIYYGLPYLKQIREDKHTEGEQMRVEELPTLGQRPVRINLSVETVCINMVTDEPLERCLSAVGCRSTCESLGCDLFGLYFYSSDFENGHCYCNCLEENKIKQALSPR